MLSAIQRSTLDDLVKTYKEVTTENTVYYGKELPVSSFVPFKAKRLRNARLLWVNHALLRDYGVDTSSIELSELEPIMLEAFAYAIPAEGDDPALYCDEEKEFVGERYGAQTETANGGGVRCGLNGRFQIKGIGKNPLAATNVDHWHTYGGATLDEGVLEALWGEITHQELPFGGVRILALIATGKVVESNYGRADGIAEPAASALMIREPNIRPAHYERSIYYKPHEATKALLVPDFMRVEDAIQRIELSLSQSLEEPVGAGVKTLAERLARQLAAARAMRIVHGALTSSNVSIDGRYIDFGTITTLPDYGNRIIARGFPPFWNDHIQILVMLRELYFYLSKYRLDVGTNEREQVQQFFKDTLVNEQARTFLQVAGIPRLVLANLDTQVCVSFFQALQPVLSAPENEIPPVTDITQPGLLRQLLQIALYAGKNLNYKDIQILVPKFTLGTCYINSFLLFLPKLEDAVNMAGLTWNSFINVFELQSAKFDVDLTPLYNWTVVLKTQLMRKNYLQQPGMVIDEIGVYLRDLIDLHARADHLLPLDEMVLSQHSLNKSTVRIQLVYRITDSDLFIRLVPSEQSNSNKWRLFISDSESHMQSLNGVSYFPVCISDCEKEIKVICDSVSRKWSVKLNINNKIKDVLIQFFSVGLHKKTETRLAAESIF